MQLGQLDINIQTKRKNRKNNLLNHHVYLRFTRIMALGDIKMIL